MSESSAIEAPTPGSAREGASDSARWKSGLYRGVVSHRRYTPKVHRFRVRLFFLYLDLDELPLLFEKRLLWSVERRNVSSFRREDFFGDPEVPLAEAVRARVTDELGRAVTGPVRVLAHLRTFGVRFNPVRFYYVYADDGETLEAVLAEITNTPWNERHAYVIDLREERLDPSRGGADDSRGDSALRHRRFEKEFHVSPFFEMDHEYDWGFSPPGEALDIWMQNFREGRKVFEARLELERSPITAGNLARALLRYPVLPAFGLAAIYWQAFRLWLKRTPFFPHPSKAPADPAPGSRAPPKAPHSTAASPTAASPTAASTGSTIDPDRGVLP